MAISERENKEIGAANKSGKPAVVFIHGNQATPGLWSGTAKAVAGAGGIGITIDYDWRKPYPGPEREAHAAIDAVRLQTGQDTKESRREPRQLARDQRSGSMLPRAC